MPLSVQALAEAREIAKNERIEFIALLDPNAGEKDASSSLEKYQLPKEYLKKFHSNDFTHREVTVHFPTYFMFKNGEIHTEVIPGYDYKDEMTEFIKKNK